VLRELLALLVVQVLKERLVFKDRQGPEFRVKRGFKDQLDLEALLDLAE